MATDPIKIQLLPTKATQRLKELQSQARVQFGDKGVDIPFGKACQITVPFSKPFTQTPLVIYSVEMPGPESDVVHHIMERSPAGFVLILEHILPFGSPVDETSKETRHVVLMWQAFTAI